MTAPVRSDPTIVEVKLGARSYDIVIGRGLIASLGARIAALRPGAKAFIVTDENVARHDLAGRRGGPCTRRREERPHRRPARRGVEKLSGLRTGLRGHHRLAHRARRSRRRARRRRHRRSRRLRRGGGAARTRLRAGADHAAGAGQFLGRRQDRDRFQPRQESDRRFPSADPGRRRHRRCSTRCRRANSAPATPKSPNTACLATPPSSPGSKPIGATYSPAAMLRKSAREHAIAVSCRAKAAIVARDERETGDRQLLNLGHTFGHALEAACGFSDRLLHGEAIAIGMALAFGFSAARQGLVPKAEAERAIRHLAAVGLPTRIEDIPGSPLAARPADGADRAGQENKARKAYIHSGARDRRGVHRDRRRSGRGARVSQREACRAMSIIDWLTVAAIVICLAGVGVFLRQRDGADRFVARRHDAAGKAGQPRRHASSTGCWRRASGCSARSCSPTT